jgi:hypothetical protein
LFLRAIKKKKEEKGNSFATGETALNLLLAFFLSLFLSFYYFIIFLPDQKHGKRVDEAHERDE